MEMQRDLCQAEPAPMASANAKTSSKHEPAGQWCPVVPGSRFQVWRRAGSEQLAQHKWAFSSLKQSYQF